MINQYHVCDDCSTALSNDDWTSTKYQDEDMIWIQANLDSMGWIIPAGEIIDGYLDCWVCDEVCIDGQVWESMMATAYN